MFKWFTHAKIYGKHYKLYHFWWFKKLFPTFLTDSEAGWLSIMDTLKPVREKLLEIEYLKLSGFQSKLAFCSAGYFTVGTDIYGKASGFWISTKPYCTSDSSPKKVDGYTVHIYTSWSEMSDSFEERWPNSWADYIFGSMYSAGDPIKEWLGRIDTEVEKAKEHHKNQTMEKIFQAFREEKYELLIECFNILQGFGSKISNDIGANDEAFRKETAIKLNAACAADRWDLVLNCSEILKEIQIHF